MSELQETQRKPIKIKGKHVAYVISAVVVITVLVYFVPNLIKSTPSGVVSAGDNVSVFYTGSFTNGTVFQSNFNSTPFSFIAGSNQTISGFSNAVIGMRVGQIKTVTLPPSEAYGQINPSAIVTVNRSEFGNSSASLKIGELVGDTAGQTGKIIAINSTSVTVDFNPPLAGDTLVFKIEVAKINK